MLTDISDKGYAIILVSSGAIAVDATTLRKETRPTALRCKQPAAAVSQGRIMFLHDRFFREYDKTIAQILLRGEDIERADQKKNPVNTFEILLQMGVIPIVNENDSVSHTEIGSKEQLFSDNDCLSAFVAVLCHAEKLIILSDIDGVYDSDPAPIPPPNAF